MVVRAVPAFNADPRVALREALIDPVETNCYRLVHGAADGWPGVYLDRLSEIGLFASDRDPLDPALVPPEIVAGRYQFRSLFYKRLTRHPDQASLASKSPQLHWGEKLPDELVVRENRVQFALSFKEGYSVGLFLDQRDNRRRLLTNHVGAGFSVWLTTPANATVLNVFAYTCGFSVCAAQPGATTTNVDLSRKYLDWGQRNFRLNGLDPDRHEFIYGDAFDWMRRLRKKQRLFDLVILDPPSFSRSRERGSFQVEKDLSSLVSFALPLLNPRGLLFVSTNYAPLKPETFMEMITRPIAAANRRIIRWLFVPQPPDFPVTRTEPAYLKTAWFRLS